MTHTSTEQERDLKDIEQALRLVREAHQHEVDAYRPELYKPECDRRPKPQLDRLGDLICLLQNILYAAQQASRRAQVVPQGWKLVPDDANMTDEQAEAICAVAKVCGGGAYDIYRAALAAAPQPPEAAPVELPEPDAWMATPVMQSGRGATTVFCSDKRMADQWDYGGHPEYGRMLVTGLFTEQQVREMLAAHGIGKDKA